MQVPSQMLGCQHSPLTQTAEPALPQLSPCSFRAAQELLFCKYRMNRTMIFVPNHSWPCWTPGRGGESLHI